MKQIIRDKTFLKHYQLRIAQNAKLTRQFEDRARRFAHGERSKAVADHPLTQNKKGKRAFSITGDVRVVYQETNDVYIFLDVGSHNQVY